MALITIQPELTLTEQQKLDFTVARIRARATNTHNALAQARIALGEELNNNRYGLTREAILAHLGSEDTIKLMAAKTATDALIAAAK